MNKASKEASWALNEASRTSKGAKSLNREGGKRMVEGLLVP
jgi:hypothetical protein